MPFTRLTALCALIGVLAGGMGHAAQTSFHAEDGEIDQTDFTISTGNFGARRDTIGGWRNWTDASATEIARLSASDNSRYESRDPGSGDNSAMLFEYEFDDNRATLSQIDVQIEVAQAYNEDAIYIYLWDYTANAYTVLGSDSGTSDTRLNFAITNNPSRYLSTGGQLTLFVVNQDSFGFLAYILVDQLSVTLTSSGPHFSIDHAGGASVCERAEITLEKHLASEAIDTTFTGTADLSTSTGEGVWTVVTGDGSLNDQGNGQATYTFAATDAGTVVLGLVHTSSGSVDIDVSSGGETENNAEDPPIVFLQPGNENVRDEFNAFSYSGNDGSQNWATSWTEVGESNGPSVNYSTVGSGRCVSGRCLRIGTSFSNQESFSNRGAVREVDLTGADSATLSFRYLRGYVRGSGVATVAVSGDGGASFTTLGSYSLTGNTTSAITQSFDISAYISANTQIRFLASVTNATASIYVDNIDVSYQTSCPAGGDLSIGHDGSGIHCLGEPFSVSVRDASANLVTTYAETITLTTQTGVGDFSSAASNQGSFNNGVAGDGVATYAFNAADGGSADFFLDYSGGSGASAVASIDLDAFESANTSVRDDDSEGLLRFAPSGFLLTANALSSPLAMPVNDPIQVRTAGTAFPVHIAAFGTNNANPDCGILASYDGAKDVEFWSTFVDPTTGTRAVSINGASIGGSSGQSTSRPLTFSQGRASFTTQYKDAGQIQLHAIDRNVAEPVAGILGSSDAFVSRPADFAVVDVERPDQSANPGVSTPTGDIFVAAGEPFRATVRALDAEGDLTPNYGREASPEGIALQASSLVAPSGGRNGVLNNGAIGNASGFSADATLGSFTGTAFSFDEVGAIRLQARVADGDYLGAGDLVGSASGVVGRFTPSRFEVTPNVPEWQTACALGAFTWFGQPFGYSAGNAPTLQVRAVNAAGQITENYTGTWWRLTNGSLANRSYQINDGVLDESGLPATTADPTISGISAGQATLTFSAGGGLALTRTTPVAPFNAEIELSIDVLDLDGIALATNPHRFGGVATGTGIAFSSGKRFQLGRLRFENAFGSEHVDLPMRLVTQRFDGTTFIDDGNDSCSQISESDLQQTPSPVSLSSAPTIGNQPLLTGDANLTWSAPGATGEIAITLDLSPTGANLPWLQFDWPNDGALDGVLDDNPSATATFGIWEGRSRFIYQRETY